jgi:two-component system nitrate/nitrite response regulator NarL
MKNVDVLEQQCRVAVVSPSRLFREGLKHLLSKSRLRVEHDGNSVAALLEQCHLDAPAGLVVLDLDLDERTKSELSAVTEIRAAFPRAKIVILTDIMSSTGFHQAISAGVDGILSAELCDHVMQRSLELILLGATIFPTRHLYAQTQDGRSEQLADMTGTGKAPVAMPPGGAPLETALRHSSEAPHLSDRALWPQLSEREIDVLRGLMVGASNKAIARVLKITEATVKVHLRAVLRKIRVNNRTQAAIWATNNSAAMNTGGGEPKRALQVAPVETAADRKTNGYAHGPE